VPVRRRINRHRSASGEQRRIEQLGQSALESIPENAWTTIDDYPSGGEAQIAQTIHGQRPSIIRRTRLIGAQAALWPDWRHLAFSTNRTAEMAVMEAEHRDHAVVEQVIADLEDQALAHFPSGHFHASGAWTVLACLAHSLLRWTHYSACPTRPSARRARYAPGYCRSPDG
jgi:hypothetical protein